MKGVFDVIVVGAGAAGCVMASRLAEAGSRGLSPRARPCQSPSGPGALRRRASSRAPDVHALHALVRMEAISIPHVVGTCAMGPRPEDGAVVDSLGRVHGTERLSVVDASIMPDVPSGFTHFPTIMIAERLSEQIGSLL